MNIEGLSIAKSQTQLMMDVNTALLAMDMKTAKQMGADMIRMMEQSVTPNIGSIFDTTIWLYSLLHNNRNNNKYNTHQDSQ